VLAWCWILSKYITLHVIKIGHMHSTIKRVGVMDHETSQADPRPTLNRTEDGGGWRPMRQEERWRRAAPHIRQSRVSIPGGDDVGGLASGGRCARRVEDGACQQRPGASLTARYDLVNTDQLHLLTASSHTCTVKCFTCFDLRQRYAFTCVCLSVCLSLKTSD